MPSEDELEIPVTISENEMAVDAVTANELRSRHLDGSGVLLELIRTNVATASKMLDLSAVRNFNELSVVESQANRNLLHPAAPTGSSSGI